MNLRLIYYYIGGGEGEEESKGMSEEGLAARINTAGEV